METADLSLERRREMAAWIVAWIETYEAIIPKDVVFFLKMHLAYLATEKDPNRKLNATVRELRRAMGILPSSERRSSGSPLVPLPPQGKDKWADERERLEMLAERSARLSDWHDALVKRHARQAKRIKERLARMATKLQNAKSPKESAPQQDEEPIEEIPVEEIELTEEEKAETKKQTEQFLAHLRTGDGADPALQSVNETLMPGGAVITEERCEYLEADVPEDLANATVVKTTTETRSRYDFAFTVSRIALEVEKKILEDEDGSRYVVTASTGDWGPPRYSVTWDGLATLAVLVGQLALPFNRLATMCSTPDKRFSAGSLGRMLHYVAERLVPIYLELGEQLANSDILAGDDTTCRVLEVAAHFRKAKVQGGEARPDGQPSWADYRTPKAAEESFRRCGELKKARVQRREDGDRSAIRTDQETPSLGVLIGRRLPFESSRRDGDGPKKSMNTTVVSGRRVADDPRSLIVFYRSHLGSCGNVFEALLHRRDPERRDVFLQGDLSSTNFVKSPELLDRLNLRVLGCTSHARRPFAIHEDDDPVNCQFMLHLFKGLAIHEQRLDVHGRNRENVLAVRQNESRRMWEMIKDLAQDMTERWSKSTDLGAGARYIINHFDELTAYLDDPRLEPTNNHRERMLRTEKLIESSSMFRKSLEGRFALDVVRTVLQTAVAAGVPVHEYIVSVLRASPEDVAHRPADYTPSAWHTASVQGSPPAAGSAD
jgi:hypothetical protein